MKEVIVLLSYLNLPIKLRTVTIITFHFIDKLITFLEKELVSHFQTLVMGFAFLAFAIGGKSYIASNVRNTV